MNAQNKIVAVVGLGLASVASSNDATKSFTLPSGVSIQIIETPFVSKGHDIKGCTGDFDLCIIDGRIPYGSFIDLPHTRLKSMIAVYRGKRYSLDTSQMFNAWGRRPLTDGDTRYFGGGCYDEDNCLFRGLFSDGAGTFVAEWRVRNGVSERTILTRSTDVMNVVRNNIDAGKPR
jgi:hypothetical protein